MTSEPLEIGQTLDEAWQGFKANAGVLIAAPFVVGILAVLSLGICVGPLTVGWYRACLRAARGEVVDFSDVFSGFSIFGPAFVLGLLWVLIMVGVSSAVGLVPVALGLERSPLIALLGQLLAWLLGFLLFWSWFFMADGETNPIECLRRSVAYNLSRPGPAFLFYLVSSLIGFAGIFACVVGVYVTAPLQMTMQAAGYLRAFRREGFGPAAA